MRHGKMLLLRTGPPVTFLCTLLLFLFGNAGASQSRSLAPGNGTSPSLVDEGIVDHQCWIFTHLKKAGGSTIKTIIHERWGTRKKLYDCWNWPTGYKFAEEFSERLLHEDMWDVIEGGYTEALRPYVGDTCKWFTMFRHPVSRLVSAYFYCQKRPVDPTCATERLKAVDADLLTFAKHWGNFGLRMFVLSMLDEDDVFKFKRARKAADLSKDGPDPGWYVLKTYLEAEGRKLEGTVGDQSEFLPEEAVLHDMVRPVRELLREKYTAVGILESFDDTLELFNRALGMPGVEWHSKFEKHGIYNWDEENKKKEEAVLAEAWTNAEIKKYISLDLLIYEHAVAVFNEQKKLHGI